jgi:uncharacterized membrane protein YkvA (DUF1232 family)
MARTASRWGLLATIVTAVRTTLRPGSPGISERLYAVPRLVGATLRGDYPGASRRHLAMLLGAALYIVSPVDFMPEALLSVFGLADDTMVTGWLAASLLNDTEAFLAWERRRQADGSGGTARSGQDRSRGRQDAPASACCETVRSHVVG